MLQVALGICATAAADDVRYQPLTSDNGQLIGFGSGLALDRDGNILAITDRGPNELDSAKRRIFPQPSFNPQVALLDPKTFRVKRTVRLLGLKREPLTGLPPGNGESSELPFDSDLRPIAPNRSGIDPEGIAVHPGSGRWWISEEYGPSLLEIDPASGQTLRRFSPGSGLPNVFSRRDENRGFEGIAVLTDGRVLASLQSVPEETNSHGEKLPILFLLFDPTNLESKIFIYPNRPRSLKIGDLDGSDPKSIRAIENYKKNESWIVELDISSATPLDEAEVYSRSVETIRPIARRELIDLRKHAWAESKTEGLVTVRDGLLISADDDFAPGKGTPMILIRP